MLCDPIYILVIVICHFHPKVSRNSDRNYVVMEVRSNLLKEHWRDPLAKSLKFFPWNLVIRRKPPMRQSGIYL